MYIGISSSMNLSMDRDLIIHRRYPAPLLQLLTVPHSSSCLLNFLACTFVRRCLLHKLIKDKLSFC